MAKLKKRFHEENIYLITIITVLLVALCLGFGYFIMTSDFLKPNINDLTASYISFNNSDRTDMIKITSLQVLNESKGKSNKNKSIATFDINGKNKSKYKVVIYHLGNAINDKYVRYALYNDGKIISENKISDLKETDDNGRIIYEGEIKNKNTFTIKMWIDKSYDKTPNNISYELKIKN